MTSGNHALGSLASICEPGRGLRSDRMIDDLASSSSLSFIMAQQLAVVAAARSDRSRRSLARRWASLNQGVWRAAGAVAEQAFAQVTRGNAGGLKLLNAGTASTSSSSMSSLNECVDYSSMWLFQIAWSLMQRTEGSNQTVPCPTSAPG